MAKLKREKRAARGVLSLKKRPRGKAFPKGNKLGTPFPKGVSGNPGGRPKFGKISDALRALLALGVDEPIETRTNADVMAVKLFRLGKKGHLSAIREVGDRSEGRPAQSLVIDERGDPVLELIASMEAASRLRGVPEGFIALNESGEENEAAALEAATDE